MVRLGEVNFQSDGETDVQERRIAQIIKHPDYRPPSKYNDIALVMLDSPVNFDGYVRPACLNVDGNVPQRGIASGFGRTSYGKYNILVPKMIFLSIFNFALLII